MIQNYHTSRYPMMKRPTLLLFLAIVIIIIATLLLPWSTQVITVNDYLYSVSKAGAETVASLPAVLPLALTLFVILLKPGRQLNGRKKKIVFATGLTVFFYAGYYYCQQAAAPDSTPGFGVLLAFIGGILLVLACLFTHDTK